MHKNCGSNLKALCNDIRPFKSELKWVQEVYYGHAQYHSVKSTENQTPATHISYMYAVTLFVTVELRSLQYL